MDSTKRVSLPSTGSDSLTQSAFQGPLANNTKLREAVKLFDGKVQGSGEALCPSPLAMSPFVLHGILPPLES